MNEIILDTETTGLSIKEDHRIIEIACIETKIRYQSIRYFITINPERRYQTTLLKFVYSTKIKKRKKFSEIAKEQVEFIAGKPIIHNAPFDIGFLHHEFKNY